MAMAIQCIIQITFVASKGICIYLDFAYVINSQE